MAPDVPENASPRRLPPAARPGFVPGAKKARHLRLARITRWVIAVGIVLVASLVVWLVARRPGGSGDPMLDICRKDLGDIATWVRSFREKNARLPSQLSELMSMPGYPYDAEPWDCWHRPYDYRVVDAERGTFRLRAFGPDKKSDTADDLVWPAGESWK